MGQTLVPHSEVSANSHEFLQLSKDTRQNFQKMVAKAGVLALESAKKGKNLPEDIQMTNSILTTFLALSALLVLCPVKSPAKDYVLTVGNEQLRFVPQGEKGYVVKQPKRTAGISALAGTLFLEEGQVRPIGGLDRHGIWIVENDGPASRNDAVMAELIQDGAAEYVAPLFSSGGETVAIIPEIVVRAKPGTGIEQVQELCKTAGCAIKKRMEFTVQEYLLEVLGPDASAVFAAVEALNQSSKVEWAAPNTAFQPKLAGQSGSLGPDSPEEFYAQAAGQSSEPVGVFPNDEYFPMQWHLYNTGQSGGTPGADIRAPEAWEITTGDPNIVVAVLDCGVDTNHPDLINNLVAGYDFFENDPYPDPALVGETNLHGTACAGLVAAQGNNSIGVTGVTWNCKVMPIRQTQIQPNPTTEDIGATALRWAAAHGADVLNGRGATDYPTAIIHSAIVDITKPGGIGRNGKGCVLVYPAINANALVYYPARYPEVIAVGATDHRDLRWGYSNYGPELDIMAPGGPTHPPGTAGDVFGIWTTDIAGIAGGNGIIRGLPIPDYFPFGGTSAAAPIVAGVAALILSVEPNLTNDEVRHFLERSAKDLGDPGWDDYYGWGRVDARAALDMVLAKRADLNDDWKVDFSDFAVFAQCWKTDDLRGDIGPIPRPDGVLDVQDLALMGEYWLKEIPDLYSVARWKLDETEGETAHESINHRDGTLHGSPTWHPTAGKVNGALELDGVDDYVSTPFILDPAAGAFSVFAWVKGGAPGQVIVSQTGGANWLVAGTSQGKLMTELKAAGRFGTPLFSEAVIIDGDWHRVGLTWDGTNRTLFVDNVEVAKGTEGTLAGSTGGLYIGAGKSLEAGSFWSGLIDDVRIHDRAVSP
jgi:subtilisin family serine protease